MKRPTNPRKLRLIKGRENKRRENKGKKALLALGKQKLIQQLIKAQENSERSRVLGIVMQTVHKWKISPRLVKEIGAICWTQNRRIRNLERDIVREREYVNKVLEETVRKGALPSLTVRVELERKMKKINQKIIEGRKIIQETPEQLLTKFNDKKISDVLWRELTPFIFGSYSVRFTKEENSPSEGR